MTSRYCCLIIDLTLADFQSVKNNFISKLAFIELNGFESVDYSIFVLL